MQLKLYCSGNKCGTHMLFCIRVWVLEYTATVFAPFCYVIEIYLSDIHICFLFGWSKLGYRRSKCVNVHAYINVWHFGWGRFKQSVQETRKIFCVCVLHIFCIWTIICIDIFLQLKLTLHLLSWFSYRLSWDRIQHLCQLRRHYVHLYAGSLKQSSNANVSELREMEKDLDPKVILLWRYENLFFFLIVSFWKLWDTQCGSSLSPKSRSIGLNKSKPMGLL